MPERVLPVSTKPPRDIASLFQTEIQKIRDLLRPKTRHHVEAGSRLRGLAILESAVQGESVQPTDSELKKLGNRISTGEAWNRIFLGVASLDLTVKGYGPSLDLKITQKEGIPVYIVPAGTPGTAAVGIKRVDELAFYNMNLTKLAEKVGLTGPKTLAMIKHFDLQSDRDCFKEITLGAMTFKRYSMKALDRIKKELPVVDMNKIWAQYGPGMTKHKKSATL